MPIWSVITLGLHMRRRVTLSGPPPSLRCSLESDENFVDAKIRLSFIYEQQKSYEEAISAMNEAIEAKEDDPSLYRLLIGLNKEAGSLTRAMEIADEAVEALP